MALLAVVAIAGWHWWFRPEDTLEFSGTIEAKTIDVGSPVGDRIVAVHVSEGQKVRAGDVIAEFEADTVRHEVSEQQRRGGARGAIMREGCR